jgi:hypothetical protein
MVAARKRQRKEDDSRNKLMRKLFILPFVLFFVSALCQQAMDHYASFLIENKEVVWMDVYHEEPKVAADLSGQLYEYLKSKTWIKNLRAESGDLVADLNEYTVDYKRYGGKFLNTSAIIRTGMWRGKMRASFKDGKYRIVVYGLRYTATTTSTGATKATIENHRVSGSLSQWVLDDLRINFRKNKLGNLDILHLSLKDSFTVMENQLIDNDW